MLTGAWPRLPLPPGYATGLRVVLQSMGGGPQCRNYYYNSRGSMQRVIQGLAHTPTGLCYQFSNPEIYDSILQTCMKRLSNFRTYKQINL